MSSSLQTTSEAGRRPAQGRVFPPRTSPRAHTPRQDFPYQYTEVYGIVKSWKAAFWASSSPSTIKEKKPAGESPFSPAGPHSSRSDSQFLLSSASHGNFTVNV